MSKVLVIEDDPDVRELERLALTCGGHDVVMAANGNEGLRALERERPCMILLDLMMPVMDGLTFLVERRRRGVCADVPVVCVSAGGPDMLSHAMKLGADDCLPKPTGLDELCAKVAQWCGD